MIYCFQDQLEKKIEYCDHLLMIADVLTPGPSEMRGYLLWQSHTARMRLAQWKWIRMRTNTAQYLAELNSLTSRLDEVSLEIIDIVGVNRF